MFLTVARTGSIAQASEAENVAASAISKRISDLEDQIGTQLFYRQTRGVELTPAGHQLARHSSNILQLVEQMDSQMLDFASGAKGSVRIAANTSAITQFLPEDLAGFVDQYPDVRIDLSELTSDEILSAVRAGFADLGIFSGMVEEPELDILTYRRDTLVLVMGQDHAFRPTHPVKLAEFAMLDMVGLQAGSSLQAFLEARAIEANLVLKTRVETLSFDGVRRMVEAGLGVAVLPLGAVEPYLESARLRMQKIDEDWAVRTLKLAVKDVHSVSRPVRALVEHLISQSLPIK
jgi:DNA-binding transcriptional LysR family regulator